MQVHVYRVVGLRWNLLDSLWEGFESIKAVWHPRGLSCDGTSSAPIAFYNTAKGLCCTKYRYWLDSYKMDATHARKNEPAGGFLKKQLYQILEANRGKDGLGNSVTADDRIDIQASLGGDENAFARLVRRYEAQVAAQMWRFTRDRTVLEELVQDVFVEVYLSLPGFRGRAPFLHWLRRIATRVGYRFWKQKAREENRREALSDRLSGGLQAAEDQTPSEAAELLHLFLEQLPPKDRLVLTLLYFEECDTREIAERTGWTRTLVKVRAHRARQKLKTLLEIAGFWRNQNGKSPE